MFVSRSTGPFIAEGWFWVFEPVIPSGGMLTFCIACADLECRSQKGLDDWCLIQCPAKDCTRSSNTALHTVHLRPLSQFHCYRGLLRLLWTCWAPVRLSSASCLVDRSKQVGGAARIGCQWYKSGTSSLQFPSISFLSTVNTICCSGCSWPCTKGKVIVQAVRQSAVPMEKYGDMESNGIQHEKGHCRLSVLLGGLELGPDWGQL